MPTASHNAVGIVPESRTSWISSPVGSGMAAESKSSQSAQALYLYPLSFYCSNIPFASSISSLNSCRNSSEVFIITDLFGHFIENTAKNKSQSAFVAVLCVSYQTSPSCPTQHNSPNNVILSPSMVALLSKKWTWICFRKSWGFSPTRSVSLNVVSRPRHGCTT